MNKKTINISLPQIEGMVLKNITVDLEKGVILMEYGKGKEYFIKAKKGERWNANKKGIEDIPQPRFKAGDKVKIKDGISSKTHGNIKPIFTSGMDAYIGRKLIVKEYIGNGRVIFSGDMYGPIFDEDWLEPWSDEPKKGDLAIFWDDNKDNVIIRIYNIKGYSHHSDSYGHLWKNAIKFESKEQFEKILRGEI